MGMRRFASVIIISAILSGVIFCYPAPACRTAPLASAQPAEFTFHDDFTGENDSVPDQSGWDIVEGSPLIRDNMLWCENTGNWNGAKIVTKRVFTGDQDATFRVRTSGPHFDDQNIFVFICAPGGNPETMADGYWLINCQDDYTTFGDGFAGLSSHDYVNDEDHNLRASQLDHEHFETCTIRLRGTVLTLEMSGGGSVTADIGTDSIRYMLSCHAYSGGRETWFDDFSVTMLDGSISDNEVVVPPGGTGSAGSGDGTDYPKDNPVISYAMIVIYSLAIAGLIAIIQNRK